MTDQELKLQALQFATHATLNTGGTLEKAKEFYNWLNPQIKKSTVPASDNPHNFKQPELKDDWDKVPGHDNAAYLNTKKIYDEQEASRIAKARGTDKSCGAIHDKEQVRTEEDPLTNYGYEASVGNPVVYVDSLPTSFHINDILVTIKQKPK